MISTKINPKGIDIPIQSIQEKIYSELKAIWDISDQDWNCYGRVYREQDETGKYYPLAYTGEQLREYSDDTIYSDKVKCTSFFGESGKRDMLPMNRFKAYLHLVFCLNVKAIKEFAHRGDEEIHMDVTSVLAKIGPSLDVVSVEQWMDNVFREYNSDKIRKLAMVTDMHPAHCFRVNFTTTFNNTNC